MANSGMENESLHTWAIKAVKATLKRCFRNVISNCQREAEASASLAAELKKRAKEAGLA